MTKVFFALLTLTPVIVLADQLRVSQPVTLTDRDMSRMSDGVLDAWLAYTIARQTWVLENVPHEASTRYSRSLEEEMAGREMLVAVWDAHVKKHPNAKDTYLDQVAAVSSAGFLREYVWTYLGSRKWKEKPEGLRLDEFWVWNEAHLLDHRAKTLSSSVRLWKKSTVQPNYLSGLLRQDAAV